MNSLGETTQRRQRFILSHQEDKLEGDDARRRIGAGDKFPERVHVEDGVTEGSSSPACDIAGFGQGEREQAERRMARRRAQMVHPNEAGEDFGS
ncbi:hypothetical protein ANAPRD1_01183 [Anaplasma phagocytophilum]|nr:hypothetical protein ANAPC5_01312 [Anaplasma phagocytophilum]SCV66641.1 hypothetical protein ANAPRD1_01183 [Anaplasma phagocytophilum]